MKISLILPVYNEQAILGEVLQKYLTELREIAKGIGGAYELIAINDGCTDASLEIMKKEAKLDRNFRIVNFDTRYGKQSAITAGFEAARGDIVILADVDLLNPIGVLEKVLLEFFDGHDIVYAYRESIGFERTKRNMSHRVVSFATRFFGVDGAYMGKANVMLFSRDIADILKEVPEKNKFMRTMDNWVGYEIKTIEYASGYSAPEIKQKVSDASRTAKQNGMKPAFRSTAREHTPSRVYGWALLLLSIMFLPIWIFVGIQYDVMFVWHIVALIVLGTLIFSSILFFIRALMIKRIGIIYNQTQDLIYKVESVINNYKEKY
ncbi:MAG: glycosyltransferase [Firmicutes bacterium]|nr:glycosyltransferase [Bacillota bacterium]